MSNEGAGALIRKQFATLLQCPNSDSESFQPYEGNPHSLQVSITSWEVKKAMNAHPASSNELSGNKLNTAPKNYPQYCFSGECHI